MIQKKLFIFITLFLSACNGGVKNYSTLDSYLENAKPNYILNENAKIDDETMMLMDNYGNVVKSGILRSDMTMYEVEIDTIIDGVVMDKEFINLPIIAHDAVLDAQKIPEIGNAVILDEKSNLLFDNNDDVYTGRAYKTNRDKPAEFVFVGPIYNGKKDGLSYEYRNGKLNTITPFEDGVINGVKKEFWTFGGIFRESEYINGELNGDVRVYYSSSKKGKKELRKVTSYKNGKKHGLHQEYGPLGYLTVTQEYSNGIKIGDKIEYPLTMDMILNPIYK